jgi:hypothetical protein
VGELSALDRQKHAFALFTSSTPFSAAFSVVVSPGQGPGSAANCTRFASESSVATDDPVNLSDPSGRTTIGLCGVVSAWIAIIGGLGGSAGACLQRTQFTSNTDIGISETVGAFSAGLGASVGGELEVMISSADRLQQLEHWFTTVSVDVSLGPGFGIGANADVFWATESGHLVWGVQAGAGLGAGYGGYFYKTNTWVQQVHQWWLADPLRAVWGGLRPSWLSESAVNTILHNAKKQIPAKRPRG